MFEWLRRKSSAQPRDPLQVFDGVIEKLERQTHELRKSAATLLAARGELKRSDEQSRARLDEVRRRLITASGDGKTVGILNRDVQQLERAQAEAQLTLAKSEADAQLLLDAAHELSKQLEALKDERRAARLKLTVGAGVSEAMRAKVDELDRALKLDAARDDIERAHALADVVRDDLKVR